MIRWLDHTADVQVEIVCETYASLFVDFVTVLRDLLVTGEVNPAEARGFTLTEPAPPDLLIALGREVLFHFNTAQFVPSRLEVASSTYSKLEGTLWGEPFDPARHRFHLEVKGITYHDLEVKEIEGKWYARVTFDV